MAKPTNDSTALSREQQQNREVAKAPKTLRDWLKDEKMQQQVAVALPKHLSADRFMRIALTTLTRTPDLAKCDQNSFFDKLLTLSQLGLEPDGRRAHLIPFKNTKRGVVECQLIIDYKGLVELILRTGLVSFVHADVVCEGEEFEYDKGEVKSHKPDLKGERTPSTVYAAYAICRFKDGTEKCEVMTKSEIDAIRRRSRASSSGPWVTDWMEMAKKTVFRRLSKWLPWSPEIQTLIDKTDYDRPADILDGDYSRVRRSGLNDSIGAPALEAPAEGEEPDDEPQYVPQPGADADTPFSVFRAEIAAAKTAEQRAELRQRISASGDLLDQAEVEALVALLDAKRSG